MTTTKALAKVVKKLVGKEGKNSLSKNLEALADGWNLPVGSDGRNSAAKILSDLADNWSSAGLSNAAKIPALPTLAANGTKYYVLKVVKSSSGTTYTWDEKTFT